MSEPETDIVKVTIVKESDKAFLMTDDNSTDNPEAWFPKSEVTFKRRNVITGKAVAEIPLWLLSAKGWNQ